MLPFFVVVRASLTFMVFARVWAENIFSSSLHAYAAVVHATIWANASFPIVVKRRPRTSWSFAYQSSYARFGFLVTAPAELLCSSSVAGAGVLPVMCPSKRAPRMAESTCAFHSAWLVLPSFSVMVMPKNGFWLAAALDLVDMMVEA